MRNQSGFTLLELLIAMTLTALVLVMLYSGLRLGIRSWDAGEARAERVNELRLVQDFIRRRIRESITVYETAESGGRVVDFAGRPDSLAMVAPMLTHLGLGGLYVVQFDAVEENGVGQLRMRWRPYRPGAQAGGDGEHARVLLDGVSELRWTYFGPEQTGQPPQWHDQWQNVSQRPELVRLVLKLQGVRWPDLVARVTN